MPEEKAKEEEKETPETPTTPSTEEPETPETPEEKEEKAGGEKGFVEIEGKKFKEDPAKPGEPLKDGETGEPVPFEEKEEKKEEKEPERTPRLMEVYKHKIAERKWGKEKEVYEGKIVELTTKLEGTKDAPERKKMIEEFAEKSGMDTESVEAFLKIAELPLAGFRKELNDLKTGIQKSSDERAWQYEDAEFEKDFTKNIIPLLDADKVPQENRDRLKKLLNTLSFTTKYAKNWTLPEIYRGVEDFKQFLPGAKKKSGELTRGGIRGAEGEVDILGMTPPQFEAYIKEQGPEKKFEIRRDGRPVSE